MPRLVTLVTALLPRICYYQVHFGRKGKCDEPLNAQDKPAPQ